MPLKKIRFRREQHAHLLFSYEGRQEELVEGPLSLDDRESTKQISNKKKFFKDKGDRRTVTVTVTVTGVGFKVVRQWSPKKKVVWE